jgi:hypothetical protein
MRSLGCARSRCSAVGALHRSPPAFEDLGSESHGFIANTLGARASSRHRVSGHAWRAPTIRREDNVGTVYSGTRGKEKTRQILDQDWRVFRSLTGRAL